MTDSAPAPLITDAPTTINFDPKAIAQIIQKIIEAEPQMVALLTEIKSLEGTFLARFLPAKLLAVLDNPMYMQAVEYLPKFEPYLLEMHDFLENLSAPPM